MYVAYYASADGGVKVLDELAATHAQLRPQCRARYFHMQDIVSDILRLGISLSQRPGYGVPGFDEAMLQQRRFKSVLPQIERQNIGNT